jgi:hypothetical protein
VVALCLARPSALSDPIILWILATLTQKQADFPQLSENLLN